MPLRTPDRGGRSHGTDYAEILKATLEMDAIITEHSAIMDRYDPEKKVALVDEWGAWYAPLPGSNPRFLVQQNSQRDAISVVGETLTAPAVDSVNTFDAPKTVASKPITGTAQGDRLALTLEPKSVTVVAIR